MISIIVLDLLAKAWLSVTCIHCTTELNKCIAKLMLRYLLYIIKHNSLSCYALHREMSVKLYML